MTIDTTVPVSAKANFSTKDIINLETEYSAYVHPSSADVTRADE